MNRDRKLSVLESLLERVRRRAAAPRTEVSSPVELHAAVAVASASAAPAFVDHAPASTEITSLGEAAPVAPATPPPAIHLEAPRPQAHSEPPTIEAGEEEDEGPPSAPRLREGIATDEEQEQEQDFQDDEGPIKTPPPESGRHHVAAQVAPDEVEPESADDLEMDIAITVADTNPEPEPAPEPEVPVAPIAVAPSPEPVIEMAGPPPRLAFVSEPEIELHVHPRAPTRPSEPPAEAPAAVHESGVIPVPFEHRAPVVEIIAPEPVAPPEPEPEPIAAVAAPAVAASQPPPPVRLMTQAGPEAQAERPPVEVWASTHAPVALRGQVASFVGQNASFAPSSFGELLTASIELGES